MLLSRVWCSLNEEAASRNDSELWVGERCVRVGRYGRKGVNVTAIGMVNGGMSRVVWWI